LEDCRLAMAAELVEQLGLHAVGFAAVAEAACSTLGFAPLATAADSVRHCYAVTFGEGKVPRSMLKRAWAEPVQASGSVTEAVERSLAAILQPASGATLDMPGYPEFAKATAALCLGRRWLGHTSLFRHQKTANDAIKSGDHLSCKLHKDDFFDAQLVRCIRKAYHLQSDEKARRHECAIVGGNVYQHMAALRQKVGGDRSASVCWAVLQLAEHSSADTIVAKFAEVADRVHRCESAQKQAYNLLLVHAGGLVDAGRAGGAAVQPSQSAAPGVDGIDGAVGRVHAAFEDFLDDHKERAYKSAFEEPARYYYHVQGDGGGRDHVNVHGTNWYAVALHAGLGVSVPLVPEEEDVHFMAVAHFWGGLTPAAWTDVFATREHFGKEFEGIAPLRGDKSRFFRKGAGAGPLDARPPRQLRDSIRKDAGTRKMLAVYLERFSHFFSSEFFVRAAYEALNSELKPQHAGFRAACATLYGAYAQELGLAAPTLDEHLYDEYFTALDVPKASRFLSWVGLLEPTADDVAEMDRMRRAAASERRRQEQAAAEAAARAKNAEAEAEAAEAAHQGKELCPICYEYKADVASLDHWTLLGEARGDVTQHKMCADCIRAWGRNECPFCKEVLLKDSFMAFMQEFLSSVEHASSDANASAALLEELQLFEMQHDGQPTLIKRVFGLIAVDPHLCSKLDGALKGGASWPRDMAGILLRLHAMAEAGELRAVVDSTHAARLSRVVDSVWAQFEGNEKHMDPHFWGALYSQALVAWLCAWRGGMASAEGLAEAVRRAGRALVRMDQVRHKSEVVHERVRERLHEDYIALSHVPVWGAQDKDVVYTAFYGKKKN